MGAFNTLTADVACPACGRISPFEVQFKFGSTWQYLYRLGDELSWGGNNIGVPGQTEVLVGGIARGPCPHCAAEFLDFDIVVNADRLVEVRPVHVRGDEYGAQTYRIIKP